MIVNRAGCGLLFRKDSVPISGYDAEHSIRVSAANTDLHRKRPMTRPSPVVL